MPELTNSQILETPDNLLTAIQKQHKFLLVRDIQQCPCPNCGTPQSFVETAAGGNINDYNAGNRESGPYPCINCGRGLTYVVPLVYVAGPGWHWSLTPIGQEPEKK
jgi:hypothetical protein